MRRASPLHDQEPPADPSSESQTQRLHTSTQSSPGGLARGFDDGARRDVGAFRPVGPACDDHGRLLVLESEPKCFSQYFYGVLMMLDSSIGQARFVVDQPCLVTSATSGVVPFKSEAILVRTVKDIVAPLLDDVVRITDEFNCEDGIADLVIYQLQQNWHLSTSLQYLSPRWAAALHALPYRRGFTVDWFGTRNLVTRQRAFDALREYELAGFCERASAKDTWIKLRQPRPISTQICAVEAKLRDWRRALSQAARYRSFAHQTWVLLDEASIGPALANLDRFIGLNVGLASISTGGDFFHYHVPKKHEPSDHWRFWLANVLIARLVTGSNDVGNRS